MLLQEQQKASAYLTISSTIKTVQEQAGALMLTSQSGPALAHFSSCVEQLYTTEVNAVNISTILTALTHLWMRVEAKRSPQQDQFEARSSMEAVYKQSLEKLQPMLQSMDAQAISNTLWASAKFGMNPDDHMPNMVQAFIEKFTQLMIERDKRRHPKAQECANLMWSLTTMKHPAATRKLLDKVCGQFASRIGSTSPKNRPNAQETANLMWALGTLKLVPTDTQLLNKLCFHFVHLLESKDTVVPVTAQGVSNVLWSLRQQKHAPPHATASALLRHLPSLCQPSAQRLARAQNISLCLMSSAELRLTMTHKQVQLLLDMLWEVPVTSVRFQTYCNITWSLAVMGLLTLDIFDTFLSVLTSKVKLLLKARGMASRSAQLQMAELRQLYQAADWLKPREDSQQMHTWSALYSRLQEVAPEPPVVKIVRTGHDNLYATLVQLSLPFQTQVPMGRYCAHAVLSKSDGSGGPVILMLEHFEEFIWNGPGRCGLWLTMTNLSACSKLG